MKKTARLLSFAIAAMIAAGTVACASRDDKGIGRANAEEIAEDSEALKQLRAAGSDVAKPHRVEFYVYAPSEEAAEAAAAAVRLVGYTARVSAGEEDANWLCVASRTMLPTIAEITVARNLFKGVAQKYQGAYGGWSAAIEH